MSNKKWQKQRLISICDIVYGFPFDSSLFNNTKKGVPLIRIRDLTKFTGTYTEEPFPEQYWVNPGDVLIGMDGEFNIVSWHGEKACLNQRVCKLISKGSVSVEYLSYALRDILKRIEEHKNYSTVKHLSAKDLNSITIPLPPLSEQKRIVDKIRRSFERIDAIRRNVEKKLQLSQELFQQAFVYEIKTKQEIGNPTDETAKELLERIRKSKARLIKESKFKKDKPFPPINANEIPFAIPETWEWVRLGEIGIYKKGPFGSALTKSVFVPKGSNTVKVYEQKNAIQKNDTLGNYYITREYFNTKMSSFEVFPGDVIVSCAGTIGETYIMPESIEQGIINQALMRMRIVKEIDLNYFLTYFDFILKDKAKSKSNGSAIKNIPPFDVFKSLLIPLPPLSVQKRIVERLEAISSKCSQLESDCQAILSACDELEKTILLKTFQEDY